MPIEQDNLQPLFFHAITPGSAVPSSTLHYNNFDRKVDIPTFRSNDGLLKTGGNRNFKRILSFA
ncbi:MAG: hypothetical protein WCE98_08515 [Chlorobium sp.]